MTPYIKNQLIKLCDHPEWFNDMLTIWDNFLEEPETLYTFTEKIISLLKSFIK